MVLLNSLKTPAQTRVVVAMSGGVDSSCLAALLHEQGYKVIGITLQLYDQGAVLAKKGACCAGQDIYDAKMVADRFGFPHYVLDYESQFKQAVINNFIDGYMSGETPLPCIQCNQSVKFKDLLHNAKDLGADVLVTGHYVRRIDKAGTPQLHRAIDLKKDQSYFLFATTRDQLSFLQFPLGNMTKEQTRLEAVRLGLPIADKPDSQDICFVPNGSYADFITKMKPAARISGKIIHIDGFELGLHDGIINYTIGQRKGLKIAYPEPLYIVKIDCQNNTIYVGPESALNNTDFIIKDFNWLGSTDELTDGLEVEVKIRSTRAPSPAAIYLLDDNFIHVKMRAPERAITPGQACVIYSDTQVLGGGWITREIN